MIYIWTHFCFEMLNRSPSATGIVEFVWRLRGSQNADQTTWLQGQIPIQGSNLVGVSQRLRLNLSLT